MILHVIVLLKRLTSNSARVYIVHVCFLCMSRSQRELDSLSPPFFFFFFFSPCYCNKNETASMTLTLCMYHFLAAVDLQYCIFFLS